MKRIAFITMLLGGCTSVAPDRVTIGVQFDVDTLQPRTYVVQGQWQIRHAP